METFDRLVFKAKRRALLVLGVVAIPCVAYAAGPVTAKGKLQGVEKLLNPVWNEAKDPNAHRYTFREPSPTVRPDVRTLTPHAPKEIAVVVLGQGAADKVPVNVTVAGGRTTPVTIVVPQGQVIQFENKDPFPHKLYDTGSKGFGAVETPPAKSRSWTPPAPGKYEIRDELAPSVRSWVVVEPKAQKVSYPDRKGEFTIEVEPGPYKLRAYFNGEPVGAELDVTISPFPTTDQPLKAPLVVAETAAK